MKALIFLTLILTMTTDVALAKDQTADKDKNVTIRKTQTVDFEGDTVDGQARHPDGSYLVQKRSVDFIPLYKVRERFDENIKNSIDYLK